MDRMRTCFNEIIGNLQCLNRFLAIIGYHFYMVKSVQMPVPDVAPILLPLEDLGALQARYEPLPLATRARTVLKDAGPAFETANRILDELAAYSNVKQIFNVIRNDPSVCGKMRASEAKLILQDATNDFIAATRQKLAVWQKTMERLGQGEGIAREKNHEYIASDKSVAMALLSVNALDSYLAVIQLAWAELAKLDEKNAPKYQSNIVRIRRCGTLISDYDNASSLRLLIH
jgi:hypothetical protein